MHRATHPRRRATFYIFSTHDATVSQQSLWSTTSYSLHFIHKHIYQKYLQFYFGNVSLVWIHCIWKLMKTKYPNNLIISIYGYHTLVIISPCPYILISSGRHIFKQCPVGTSILMQYIQDGLVWSHWLCTLHLNPSPAPAAQKSRSWSLTLSLSYSWSLRL